MDLNYNTMQSALELLSAEFTEGAPLAAYGLSKDDLAVLSKPSFYQQSDRVRVQRALSCMKDGVAGYVGVAPFAVPAEYVAAIICKFVHACNIRIACSWMSIIPSVPADDLAAESMASEPVTAQKLFSLVLMARGKDSAFEAGFDSKVKKAIIKGGQNV